MRPKLHPRVNFARYIQCDPVSKCWIWCGAISKGYPKFTIREGKKTFNFPAHRWAYENLGGHKKVAPELDIHHECNQPLCVNPEHLRAVTRRQHVLLSNGPAAQNARKIFCIRNHALDGDNVYVRSDGSRQCRACAALFGREKRRKLKVIGE